MKNLKMTSLLAILPLTMSLSHASPKDTKEITCEIKASSGLMLMLGQSYTTPMSYQECYEKGEALFNSTVTTGDRTILLKQSAVRERTWTTQYKKVKIKYFAPSGSVTTDTLKRSHVEKSKKVVTKMTKIKNIWKCWTQDECIAE